MNPKLEIILTFVTSIVFFLSTIGSFKNNHPLFNIIIFSLNTVIWFIGGVIKLYKYKKNNKIYGDF